MIRTLLIIFKMCRFSALLIFCSVLCIVYGLKTNLEPVCKPPLGDVCIDIYDCPFFKTMLAKTRLNRPHYVIREIRKRQCGFIGQHPAVCCPDVVKDMEVKAKAELVDEMVPKVQHKKLHLLPIEKCGGISLDSRITNGKDTSLGEYPWVALIVYNTKNGLEFLCGGSLISKRYVLTAAHCIMSNIVGVRLGEYNILLSKDCNEANSFCAPPVQDFYIESIHIHPKYNNKTDHNDIALLRLVEDADLSTGNVQPICLPLWNVPDAQGKSLTVVGWGMTEKGYKSPILKKADLPHVPLVQCQKIFQGHAIITEHQMCAGGKKKDSCNGDSGGPLSMVVPAGRTPKEIQYGIVSYGPKSCGTLGMPGIYTRVDPYVEWILDTLSP